MSEKYQDYYDKKIFIAAIFAAVFVVGSQFVQSSMAQDLSQLGQQAREKVLGQLGGGENQTGNQTDNQSDGGVEQLAEQARGILGQ